MVLYLLTVRSEVIVGYFCLCGHILESRRPKVSSQEVPLGTLLNYTACWDDAFLEVGVLQTQWVGFLSVRCFVQQ